MLNRFLHRPAVSSALLLLFPAMLLHAQSKSAPVAAPPAVKQVSAAEENPDWAVTLERIAESVVSINVDATRAFDTETSSSGQATGFVVDVQRGLILTNRHVVTAGPVTAEATFLNREEVQLYPVYRDPVHDFGFYRYDPQKLRFIAPKALPLYPQGAQVGREIRVVGNNAGEQLSILSGILARLDRDAPDYGIGQYNDFNTFYLQAASGTSPGSSGSPVIDIRGRVVALNAAGSQGDASNFYLPLGRVQRALELIQQGKPVTRGTLRTVFEYVPYDQLRRLGLREGTETAVRQAFPRQTGMLVVSEVLPDTASGPVLEPGDILLRVNGHYVTQFEPLEALLDTSVGGEVQVELERGGRPVAARLKVQDLHAITPSAFLEFGNAVVNNFSYQMARHFNRPVRGVYVAEPGYVFGAAGIVRGALITQFGKTPINALDDLESALTPLAEGDRVAVRFVTLDSPESTQMRAIRMERRWFPAQRCVRDDSLGVWPCRPLAPGPEPKPLQPASTTFPHYADPRLNSIAPALVRVEFDMPYSASGIPASSYHGTGLVVDDERGLVVVDRNTVPVTVGEATVTFAGSLEVPARVLYVHPLHNLSVLTYDPRLIGKTPVRAARLNVRELATGETLWVVGMGTDGELKSRSTQIADIGAVQLPLSSTGRFRESNLEAVQLVNAPADYDGVLLDRASHVIGLWSSFAYENGRDLVQENRGVPLDVMADMIERVREKRPLRSLEAEFEMQPLASARDFGLPEEWAGKLSRHSVSSRNVLTVVRTVAGSPAATLLQQGDLLLAIDGKVVTRFREVERAVADQAAVRVTVWRSNAEQSFDVPTAMLSGVDIDRLVEWGGATLHAPQRALSVQRGIPPTGVYIGDFAQGSPATRSGLFPGQRITEVDGVPTPDLDSFIAAISGRADRVSVRLKTIGWNEAAGVITLKLDKHYWPAYELYRSENGWERRALE